MRLWRLSDARHADSFDGGYGLLFDGRWNTAGRAVTYCATSPALCVLEKLVHIEDPGLMPALVMIGYEAPDDLGVETVALDDLGEDWRRREFDTQQIGDDWHRNLRTPTLRVPSAIVAIAGSPDANFLINHAHPDAARITQTSQEEFILDTRLF